MASRWDVRRLEHEQAIYNRLRADLETMGARLARLVNLAATTTNDAGQRIVPNRGRVRTDLKRRAWLEVVKPYFLGAGDTPLDGTRPQSPYMALLVDGIEGATRIQAEQQVALVRKYASTAVRQWLTGPRPLGLMQPGRRVVKAQDDPRKPWYDPFHLWVDPNGYRLSDRGWNTAQEARAAIDALLDHEIGRGTAAVDIAKKLDAYLWPEAAAQRTRTPYGEDGSYWARRLARTEITAAAGRSLVNAAMGNPFVSGIKWNLSLSHPEMDICDEHASGGEAGDGVYGKTGLPAYPAHPNCICFLTQEVTATPEQINAQLEAWIEADAPEARALRGVFNPDWLTAALMSGEWIGTVLDGEFMNLAKLLLLAGGGA